MGRLFHWEWLLIELAVVGWAAWELISLRRYKRADTEPPVLEPPPAERSDRPG